MVAGPSFGRHGTAVDVMEEQLTVSLMAVFLVGCTLLLLG
jgi:hypothetical protein